MQLRDFDFHLPRELIAQTPAAFRDKSRLLVYSRSSHKVIHTQFYNLPQFLNKGDVLVLNNTKVFKARLWAENEKGSPIEVFLIKKISKYEFEVLLRPKKKLKLNSKLKFGQGITAYIKEIGRHNVVVFDRDLSDLDIENIGVMPLPPYIKRKPQIEDSNRYQTVYGEVIGSIAAPTAGLHFTREVLEKIKAKGVKILFITLHIGYPTFKPIRQENILKHQMGPEFFFISKETAQEITLAKKQNRRVIAVGTSVVRALESSWQKGKILSLQGFTELFITPGFKFKVVDSFIPNFHLPKSSPFILTAAFLGREKLLELYQKAISQKYRFYSYGDSMFIN